MAQFSWFIPIRFASFIVAACYLTALTGCVSDGSMAWDQVQDSVLAGAVKTSKLAVSITSGSAPTAGSEVSLRVLAQDMDGNLVTSYQGSVLLQMSDTRGVIKTQQATFTASDQGKLELPAALVFKTAGQQKITAVDVSNASVSGSTQVVVAAAAASRYVIKPPQNAYAGAPATVEVGALDAYGNVDTNCQDDVTLVVGGAGVTGGGLVAITNGVGSAVLNSTTAQSVNLLLADSQNTYRDVSSSASFQFLQPTAIRAVRFALSIMNGTTVSAGTPLNLHIVAQDIDGNTAPSYDGTVTIRSTDGAADIVTTSATFAAVNEGVLDLTGALILKSAGTQTVSINDTSNAAISGSSNITITHTGASQYVIEAPASSVVNTPAVVFVRALDPYGNVDVAWQADVTLNAPGGGVSGAGLVDIVNGVGVKSINSTSAQTLYLSLTDSQGTGHAVSSTAELEFRETAATRLKLSGPASSAAGECVSFTITAVNASGVASNLSTPVTVDLSGKGSGAFYSDASCSSGNEVNSRTIAANSSSIAFSYKNFSPESLTLQAGDLQSVLNLATAYLPLTVRSDIAVAAGENHTCALKNGGVVCWGQNRYGQLGNSTFQRSDSPVPLSDLSSGVVALVAGANHSCALLSNGSVRCWGLNSLGQLGNNSTTNSNAPVQPQGLASGVTAISAGISHTCAVVNGAAQCWGYNYYGQLGTGSSTTSLVPASVSGLSSKVTAIAAGGNHSCALTDNVISCWGYNTNGQLGDGTSATKYIPVVVSGIPPGAVSALAAGAAHSCALVSGGVRCWGYNSYGQVGNGTTANSSAAQPVSNLNSVTQVVAGANHTCAISTGAVKCWGQNSKGQLGDDTTIQRTSPTEVHGASNATAVATGNAHSCAVIAGALSCWGLNAHNQIGPNAPSYGFVPQQVQGLTSGVTSIAAAGTSGAEFTCAVVNGAAQCWGSNSYGQLGDGTTTARTSPVQVTGLETGVSEVVTGDSFGCALLANQTVKCWGGNSYGQLGDNTLFSRLSPVSVRASDGALLSSVSAISAGAGHVCAVASGEVFCWGYNYYGQLGNASTSNARTANSTGLIGYHGVAAGNNHSCAFSSGGAKCWGYNNAYQLGNNSNSNSNAPVSVSNLTSAEAMSAGNNSTCAISNGTLKCWGSGSNGTLMNGSSLTRTIPFDASEPLTSLMVSVEQGNSGNTSCAVKIPSGTGSGVVYCSGSGFSGQLGNNSDLDTQLVPVQVSNITGATKVSSGSSHSCAIINGGAKCWGGNLDGQLGTGKLPQSLVPVTVTLP